MTYIYYKIYKPYGYLSQFTKEIETHQTLADLYDFPKNVYPIGRLDKDSEGLLLLSNDKNIIDEILNPAKKLSKTYWVQLEGIPSTQQLMELSNGIKIKIKPNNYHLTLPCKVKLIQEPKLEIRNPPIRFRLNSPTSWCEIEISEGKNRQVRKMFAKIGFPVLRLIRFSIGNENIMDLKIGEIKIIQKFNR